MKSTLYTIFFVIVFVSCTKSKNITISFINEFTIPDSTYFNGNVIGGLSGVDFYYNDYYFIVDDAKNPRVLVADILFGRDTINQIKPPIFWKDKPIYLKLLNKWHKQKVLEVLSHMIKIEKMLKKNSNLNQVVVLKNTITVICSNSMSYF